MRRDNALPSDRLRPYRTSLCLAPPAAARYHPYRDTTGIKGTPPPITRHNHQNHRTAMQPSRGTRNSQRTPTTTAKTKTSASKKLIHTATPDKTAASASRPPPPRRRPGRQLHLGARPLPRSDVVRYENVNTLRRANKYESFITRTERFRNSCIPYCVYNFRC